MISSAVVLTEERLREEVEYFSRQDAFAFDVETSGDHRGVPHLNVVTWLSMATYGRTIVIPVGHPIGTRVIGEHRERRMCSDGKARNYRVLDYEKAPRQLDRALVFDILRPLFANARITKVAHGASFDLASVAKYLGFIPWPAVCTIVLDWIQDENRMTYKLKRRVVEQYGSRYDKQNTGKHVEDFPFNTVAHYAFCDARYTWQLYLDYRDGIDENSLEEVYELELRILQLMAEMRLTGVRLDVERLEEMRENLSAQVEEAKLRLFKAAKCKFNVNSTPQKQEILFLPKSEGGQGLKPWKLTKTGKEKDDRREKLDHTCFSTDAEVLESFPTNKVASSLLEYQEVNKLLSTYILGWLGDPDDPKKPGCIYDEKIYADLVQYGARTGRFSCRDPNLQNIPTSDTPNGKLIREAFIAEDGYRLITADYDQIELVVLAHYIGEGELFNGFMEGIDPHTMTAAMVFGVDPSLVESWQRSVGKSLNFAITYGAQANKVASMIGCSVGKAEGYLETHEEKFPEIYEYKEAVLEACRQATPYPHLYTLLGRRRSLPDLLSRSWKKRTYAERQAFNSLIQGSSADIMKLAMVRTRDMLKDQLPESSIILTVHDELLLSAPEAQSRKAASILSEGMIGSYMQDLLNVPLKAEVKIVTRWSDAK